MYQKVAENYEECGTDDQQNDLHVTGSLTRVFDVTFDPGVSITNKQVYALSATAGGVSVPALDSVHPDDGRWICRRRSARPGNGPLHWKVTCSYDYSENPLTKETQVEYLFAEQMEPIDQDRNGAAIVNSSREPLDPPLEKPWNDLVVRITRNEAIYDPLVAATYIDTVNGNYMFLNGVPLPPYTMKLENIGATRFYWGGAAYWEVSYEFVIRYAVKPEDGETVFGWRRRVLDQGLYAKSGGAITRIKDDDGEPVVSPVLLDGAGQQLADGATPYYHYFETLPVSDFSVFNFVW